MRTPTKQQEDCELCRYAAAGVGLGVGYFAIRKAMELQKVGGNGNPNKALALGVGGVLVASAGLYRFFYYRP